MVINGAIAAGKSAVARALAATFREEGLAAAIIELDVLYLMLDGKPMASRSAWLRARRAAAALADDFLLSGIDRVIVEGPFWDDRERAPFIEHLTCGVAPRFVTLLVSYEEALGRVRGDPARGASRDPSFLERGHARFQAALEPLRATDLIVDSAGRTPGQVAAAIVEALAGD